MPTAGMGSIRKENTRNRILHIIRTNGRVSKMDIKKISRYSMDTVLDTVDALTAENLVYSAEKVSTKSGRRPTHLTINPAGGCFLGLSFHAAEASAALLDFSGACVDYLSEPLQQAQLSPAYVQGRINALLDGMKARHSSLPGRLFGVGVGAPGYVDERDGRCIFYPHIPGWRDVPLRAQVAAHMGGNVPVYVENNSNAMALVYKWLQPAAPDATTVVISIRSGVRMACLIGQSLYKGKNFTAGEIGHIRTATGTRYCPCGKRGCLESEISELAIREKILEGVRANRFAELWALAGEDSAGVDMDLFLNCVRAGHPDALALLDETCDFLADSVTQIVNILNPENVVFNTRLCDLGDLFFGRIARAVEERAIYVALDGLALSPVAFGEKTAAMGAAAIVMERELGFVDAII